MVCAWSTVRDMAIELFDIVIELRDVAIELFDITIETLGGSGELTVGRNSAPGCR